MNTTTKSRSRPSKNDSKSTQNRYQNQIIFFDRFFFDFGPTSIHLVSQIRSRSSKNRSIHPPRASKKPPKSQKPPKDLPRASQRPPKSLPRLPKDLPKSDFGSLFHPKTSLRTTIVGSNGASPVPPASEIQSSGSEYCGKEARFWMKK